MSVLGNIALCTGVTVFAQVSLPSARASDATQVVGAGFEVNIDTTVMSYVGSKRPLQRVQLALSNSLNDAPLVR